MKQGIVHRNANVKEKEHANFFLAKFDNFILAEIFQATKFFSILESYLFLSSIFVSYIMTKFSTLLVKGYLILQMLIIISELLYPTTKAKKHSLLATSCILWRQWSKTAFSPSITIRTENRQIAKKGWFPLSSN